mmetsp:Transcript_47023/g.135487  ORF Transcript_47023/g.135487 Transcript_47023/m.135487 type:complete len:268 (+) Transcript_47023:351-1154(+)
MARTRILGYKWARTMTHQWQEALSCRYTSSPQIDTVIGSGQVSARTPVSSDSSLLGGAIVLSVSKGFAAVNHATITVTSSTDCPPVAACQRLIASSARSSAALIALSVGNRARTSAASCGLTMSQRPSLPIITATSSGFRRRTWTSGCDVTPQISCIVASPRLRDMLRPLRVKGRITRWQRPSKTMMPPRCSRRKRSFGMSGRWSCVSTSATNPRSLPRLTSTALLSPTLEVTRPSRFKSWMTTVAVVPESQVPRCRFSRISRWVCS